MTDNQTDENNKNTAKIKVFIRIRPIPNEKIEKAPEYHHLKLKKDVKSIINLKKNEDYSKITVINPCLQVQDSRKEKKYEFQHVFSEEERNKSISNKIVPELVNNLLDGFNSTIISYGVTGSGKTHTMFGSLYNQYEEKGICIYAVEDLFEKLKMKEGGNSQKLIEIDSNTETINRMYFKIKASYIEIYNEYVIDLLKKPKKQSNNYSDSLLILEDNLKGVVIPGIIEKPIKALEDLKKIISIGNSRRTMGQTDKNQFSSRSHAIIQITIEQGELNKKRLLSKLIFVDLAGSEKGGIEKGIRAKEGVNINKSLYCLSTCIGILSDSKRKGRFVPYRDSKLTRLLKESLSGNMKTFLIACINPSPYYWEETNNTLQYGQCAMRIENKLYKQEEIIEDEKKENSCAMCLNTNTCLCKSRSKKVYQNQQKSEEDENKKNENQTEIISTLKKEINNLKEIIKSQRAYVNKDLIPLSIYEYEYNKQDSVNSFASIFNNGDNLENEVKEGNNIKTLLTSNENQIKFIQEINRNINKYNYLLDNNDILQVSSKQIEEITFGLIREKENIEKIIFFLVKSASSQSSIKKIMSHVKEAYIRIRRSIERGMNIINDYLISNIERNMILKFNMKEILLINNNNQNSLNELLSKERQLELSKFDYETNDLNVINELQTRIISLKEEISNIKEDIRENSLQKEKISEEFAENINGKRIAKDCLSKLIASGTINLNNVDLNEIVYIFEKDNDCQNEKMNEVKLVNDNCLFKNEEINKRLSSIVKEKKDKEIQNGNENKLKTLFKKPSSGQLLNKNNFIKAANQSQKEIFKNKVFEKEKHRFDLLFQEKVEEYEKKKKSYKKSEEKDNKQTSKIKMKMESKNKNDYITINSNQYNNQKKRNSLIEARFEKKLEGNLKIIPIKKIEYVNDESFIHNLIEKKKEIRKDSIDFLKEYSKSKSKTKS